jgi:hypothetical protein
VSVKRLFEEAALGPEVTQSMSEAFDLACQSLQDPGQPDPAKEIIARGMIESARRGVRDPRQLCDETIAFLGTSASGLFRRGFFSHSRSDT